MSGALPKFPRTPGLLWWDPEDVVQVRPMLVRVHRLGGAYPRTWNSMREAGPLRSRWDHHAPETDHSISYAAGDLRTALLEVYQATRTIHVTDGKPHATRWTPSRDLHLLDLTEQWLVEHGAAHALLYTDDIEARQNWARGVASACESGESGVELDGLLVRSAITGKVSYVLTENAADSFPARPERSVPLDAPGMRTVVEKLAQTKSGYRVVG